MKKLLLGIVLVFVANITTASEVSFVKDSHALNSVLLKMVGHRLGELLTNDYREAHTKTIKSSSTLKIDWVEDLEVAGKNVIVKKLFLEIDGDSGAIFSIKAILSDDKVADKVKFIDDLIDPYERAIGRKSLAQTTDEVKRSIWINDPVMGGHYYLYVATKNGEAKLYANCSYNELASLQTEGERLTARIAEEKVAQRKLASLRQKESDKRQKESDKETRKKIAFKTYGMPGGVLTLNVRPLKGRVYKFMDDSRMRMKIVQFISTRNAGLAESVVNSITKNADTSTSVVVRALKGNDDWSEVRFCVKIIDDKHDYVDGDMLNAGFYRCTGVEDFEHSRIRSFEEVDIPIESQDWY